DRLAPGDPLDDEGEVLAQEDAHAGDPWTLSTASPAASHIEVERSLNSTPYLLRIFAPSSSQAPGIRKTVIVSAGSLPSSRQALITPRATMSTRVLETIDIITAIFSSPPFFRGPPLGEPAGLGAGGFAADLGVVGRLAALAAAGVGQGEGAAAGANY